MPHRWVKMWRKTERQTRPIETTAGLSCTGFNGDPEGSQNIGTTAAAGCRPIAMLHYRNAGSGRHEGCGRAYVEGVRSVAAGTAGVEHVVATGVQTDHML